MRTSLKAALVTALVSCLAPAAATSLASGEAFTLRILSPGPLYLVGRSRIQAGAFGQDGAPYAGVAWMTLTVDGQAMPPDARAPFEWEVEVGSELDRHRIELEAVDRNGRKANLSILSSTHAFVEAVGVNLVLVPTVVRRDGRIVAGLTQADFAVLEDGAPQPIVSFSDEPMPASIAVALDNSRSMEGQLWSAQKAVTEFIRAQPPYSALSFLTFNDQLFMEQDFTYDAGKAASAVAAARVEGTRTALYDALRIGAMHLMKRPGARVLVLFTDGQDTVYEGDPGRLRSSIEAAQAADVAVFTVAYAGAGHDALRKISSETGGQMAIARSAKDLKEAFARITESLGCRYVLGYEPPDPHRRGYRNIEVRVSRQGAEVLARRGYLMR